jgi:membrane protease YdiL (CAAX protease family)
MVVILVPIVEEIFYRGFIFRIIRIRVSKLWSFIISGILFSIGHSLSLSAFLSGLILCYLFEKTKIVGPCIIAHFLWNLVWFSAKYYMAYENGSGPY